MIAKLGECLEHFFGRARPITAAAIMNQMALGSGPLYSNAI